MTQVTEVMKEWGITLVVASAGHVFLARKVLFDGDFYHLHEAQIIRSWGTKRGLNQLVRGPTPNTVLDDAAPLVTVLPAAVLMLIPCDESKW